MEENNNEVINKDNNEDSQKDTIYTSEDISIKSFNNTNYTSSTEEKQKNISYSTSQLISSQRLNPKDNRFPYCIVWTPIPIITYIIPSIGHVGIATSRGVIHDFTGSFSVSVDDFGFGKPTKYIPLDLNEREKYEYDRAIEKGDNKYNMEEHNLFINNGHSYVAYVLNQLKYKGKSNYTMAHVWWLFMRKTKYVSCYSFIQSYLGYMIFLYIVWVIVFN